MQVRSRPLCRSRTTERSLLKLSPADSRALTGRVPQPTLGLRERDMSGGRDSSKSTGEIARGREGTLPEREPSTSEDIAAFVAKAKAMSPFASAGKGRLVFALDATMSRQPTWDMACALQSEMFREAASLGSLDIRLVYYRGLNECRATPWISDSETLARLMSRIDCRGGNTQIGKVLSDARS